MTPDGFITFLLDCYVGSASDKYITKDDILEWGNQVMAGRGFQIKEELLLHICSLEVPPCAPMKSQMTFG